MKINQRTIQRLKKNYGKWVLITGATSGIGKEMALKFGEAGFNLVITGRRENLLNDLSTLLFDRYQVEAIPICGDLSNENDVNSLIGETSHLNIGVAVLNAGFGTSGKFIDANIKQEVNMLHLNCRALMVLTHHFANKMKDKPLKVPLYYQLYGGFQGVPNAAHYAATKAYVQSLGEAIALELKPVGVDVLCAAPGPVESGFSKRANMKMSTTLSPEVVGVPIIQAIGKKRTVLPGFLTKLLVYNLSMTPRWGKIRIMGKVMSGFTKHQE
ncbi:SDR family NAD(P)-dependent oxidoreductase [Microscilla marina]|nr:SDR family NAD(P)-dependent oxidoreductase [Microscilla marina]